MVFDDESVLDFFSLFVSDPFVFAESAPSVLFVSTFLVFSDASGEVCPSDLRA